MNDRISVLMATYNGEDFLAEQLESIFKQTLSVEELIVSDDHSIDATPDLLKRFAADHKLHYYENPNARGVITNFKHAASKANPAHYLAFADQDDIWLEDKLSSSLMFLKGIEEEKVPCMVYADPIVINTSGEVIATSLWNILGFNRYPHKLETILFGNPAGGCTMLINAELAKYIPGIPDNGYMHDAWLTLCAYTFGKAAVLPQSVLKYRQHDSNVTFSNAYQQQSRLKRVLKEIKQSVFGKSDLFAAQFVFVRQFYNHFQEQMDADKRLLFENFLQLENQSYLRRKLAFRRAAGL